jgi:hypothetical protein
MTATPKSIGPLKAVYITWTNFQERHLSTKKAADRLDNPPAYNRLDGRGGRIRTGDLLLPKQAR